MSAYTRKRGSRKGRRYWRRLAHYRTPVYSRFHGIAALHMKSAESYASAAVGARAAGAGHYANECEGKALVQVGNQLCCLAIAAGRYASILARWRSKQ